MAMPGIVIRVSADTADAIRGINQVERSLGQSITPAQKFGTVMKKVVGPALIGVGIAAAGMAAKLAVDGVQGAANLAEAVNKSNVVFGQSAKAITDYAKTANTALGSTEEAALQAASQFGQFGKAAGLAGTDLVTFSTDLTTLGTDLASFNNVPVDQAVNALGAALRGESEPLRKFGILLDDATLRQKALEMGIYDGEGALTSQQKTLAAYQVVLAQSGDAQGDFERTSGSLVNQQKILGATVSDLTTAFGVGFLGALEDTDAAAGGKGLTSTLQDLKPVVEELGKAVGDALVDLLEFLTLIKEIYDATNEWRESMEGNAIGTLIDSMTAALKNMAAPLRLILDLVDQVKSAWDWLQTHSFSSAIGSLPSLPGGFSAAGVTGNTRATAPTVNITVNGAIDPVGVARTIRRTLATADVRTGRNIA